MFIIASFLSRVMNFAGLRMIKIAIITGSVSMVPHGFILKQTTATRYVDHTERLITTRLMALSTGK